MNASTAMAQADAMAAEILTHEAEQAIESTVASLNAGCDPRVALRMLYGLAYMDGMLAMAKCGTPQ